MNKLIILLLAVCLVSVHAFVKREAPAPDKATNDFFETAKNSLDENWKKITDTVNPDTIKEGFNNLVNTINKAMNDLKPAEAPKA